MTASGESGLVPAPVRLLLVRHGHIDPTGPLGPDTPLSLRGQTQADWLGPTLGAEGATLLLTSPFRRAHETAERLAGPLGLEARVEPALAEFEFGWEGERSYEDVQEARSDLALWRPEDRGARESLADFQTRVTALLSSLALRAAVVRQAHHERGDALVFVTHAGVIEAAVRWAFGLTSRNPWLAEVFAPHASVTELEHWPNGRDPLGAPRYTILKRLGDTSALPGDLISD